MSAPAAVPQRWCPQRVVDSPTSGVDEPEDHVVVDRRIAGGD
ncbi:MAG: hypothetical protein ACRDQV_14545 [Pseudonocardiaceae bacterium]